MLHYHNSTPVYNNKQHFNVNNLRKSKIGHLKILSYIRDLEKYNSKVASR